MSCYLYEFGGRQRCWPRFGDRGTGSRWAHEAPRSSRLGWSTPPAGGGSEKRQVHSDYSGHGQVFSDHGHAEFLKCGRAGRSAPMLQRKGAEEVFGRERQRERERDGREAHVRAYSASLDVRRLGPSPLPDDMQTKTSTNWSVSDHPRQRRPSGGTCRLSGRGSPPHPPGPRPGAPRRRGPAGRR